MASKRHELTPYEKHIIVQNHTFFSLAKRPGVVSGSRTNENVAKATGIGLTLIKRIMKAFRINTTTTFEKLPTRRGRPKAYDVLEISPTIHDYIISQNVAGLPTTSQRICDEVYDLHGVAVGVASMTRLLKELGYHYMKGEKRHIHAVAAGNVAFRDAYLAKKLADRVTVQGPHGAVVGVARPEVYLDESFCNVNHVTGKTWLTSEKVRYGKTGQGPRACIIAAGVIRSQGPVTIGEFVEGSIEVWNAGLKRSHWDEDDYHGNFDAPQFERWFENLCKILADKYGACTIHMNGAAYHKRITNKTPTEAWLKADISAWISDNLGMVFSPKATKKTLLGLVDLRRLAPTYHATTIATKYSHLVYYTPPYHPTLQPIELIWGMVKGGLARDPVKNANEMIERVLEGLRAADDAWVKVFRHVQKKEDAFVAAAIASVLE